MNLEILASHMSLLVMGLNKILIHLCQLLAIFVITIGVIRGIVIFLKDGLSRSQNPDTFQHSRLTMGYSFSLGLSFLIGATIMQTMISSRWDDIARLTTIIAIRTLLNYLLLKAINPPDETSPKDSEIIIQKASV